MFIKYLIIQGFKSFKNGFVMELNKERNIIIGDNGIGKTTILEAINLVLKGNHNYRSILSLSNYLNKSIIKEYEENDEYPFETLPKFYISIIFNKKSSTDEDLLHRMDGEIPNTIKDILNSKGIDIDLNNTHSGIYFEYSINEELQNCFTDYINQCNDKFNIPFELYSIKHRYYSGVSCNPYNSVCSLSLVDNEKFIGNVSSKFVKKIYDNLPLAKKRQLHQDFRLNINTNNTSISSDNYTLTINPNNVHLENILDAVDNDDGISLSFRGSGEENLIKTKISISQKEMDILLLEEPENHLTSTNTRKQIEELSKLINTQLIITTHNGTIISKLLLSNVIWLKKGENQVTANTFKALNDVSLHYFNRMDNIDFIKILTAKKIILVEGAGEYILMETFLEKEKLSKEIEIISMSGRHYQPYIDLVKIVGNKMAIFTDNDGEQERLSKISQENADNKDNNIKIFTPQSLEDFTFEVTIYNANQSLIDDSSFAKSINKVTQLDKDGILLSKNCSYMLKNKTEVALELIHRYSNDDRYKIPNYILEGLKWLKD